MIDLDDLAAYYGSEFVGDPDVVALVEEVRRLRIALPQLLAAAEALVYATDHGKPNELIFNISSAADKARAALAAATKAT
jgi:hypothetical protein